MVPFQVSLMPLPFNSFGDIVTVLQLAWQIRAALSDASGARVEIDALITDIDSFTLALQQVQSSIGLRSTPLASAVENGIQHALTVCNDALSCVLAKLAGFRTRIASYDEHRWKRYWKMAAWSVLGGREEVDRLRTRLSDQIQVIHTFLFLSQAADITALSSAVERRGKVLREVGSSIHSIPGVVRRNSEIPHFIWDPLAQRNYQAYARTTLDRLQTLHSYTASYPNRRFVMQLDEITGDLHIGTEGAVSNLEERHLMFWMCAANAVLVLSCVFWRDQPCDHWQVLIGLPGPWRRLCAGTDGIREFLERETVHGESPCVCNPACTSLLAGLRPCEIVPEGSHTDEKRRLRDFYDYTVVDSYL